MMTRTPPAAGSNRKRPPFDRARRVGGWTSGSARRKDPGVLFACAKPATRRGMLEQLRHVAAAGAAGRPADPAARHLVLAGWAWPALFPGGVTSGPEEERGWGAQPATNSKPAKAPANRPD